MIRAAAIHPAMDDPGRIDVPNPAAAIAACVVLADKKAAVRYEPNRTWQDQAGLHGRKAFPAATLRAVPGNDRQRAVAIHPVNAVREPVADIHIPRLLIAHDVPELSEVVSDDRNAAAGHPAVQVGRCAAGWSAAGAEINH